VSRQSKLNNSLQKRIVSLLSKGNTDEYVCDAVNISKTAFYQWLQIGQAIIDDKPHDRKPEDTEDQKRFVDFVNAVSRARAKANMRAVDAFRSGLMPSTVKEVQTEEYTETRINPYGKEFEYKQTQTRTIIRTNPPDWRAGAQWLARRDKANWSERTEVTGKDGKAIDVDIDLTDRLAELIRRRQESKEPEETKPDGDEHGDS
jgi:hypothetical protein